MHILQVVQDLGYASTGIRIAVNDFTRAFEELGHSVQTLSFDRTNHAVEARPHGTVSVPALQFPVLRQYVLSARAAMGDFDDYAAAADVIVIHSLYGHNFTWAARKVQAHPRPCFVVPHGSVTDFCLSRGRIRKRLWFLRVREFLEKHVCMVFSAEYEQKQALRYIRPARTAILYWPAPTLPAPVQSRAAEVQQRPTLLLFGRLHPMKRTIETVTSFRRVRLENWRLCLAGPASPEISVDDLKAAAGADWGDTIKYCGTLEPNELSHWYRWANGVVLFSKGDNFSYVVAEGLLSGCPAYVSQDVGLGEFIQDRGCGRMFKIENDLDIDQSLREVMRELSSQANRPTSDYIRHIATNELSFSAFRENIRAMMDEASGQISRPATILEESGLQQSC